ncbi:helix-hairpin-helix domain-containing protein [Variovorax sp. E3]|uniref:helix-hairpin-helix domain-containing protein n=1 Tax=Variovorax sp. E3 TaxID=1914993 RepID=UPI0018DBC7AA|nr:helix-hairpin-helix domain-containing protein [Variovorax sp. E3]
MIARRRFWAGTGATIELGAELGKGGEGSVFEVVADSKSVAKIYHQSLDARKQQKLSFMAAHADKDLLAYSAWPSQTLHSSQGGPVVGFLMERVANRKPIHMLYGPAHRKQDYPKAAWDFLLYAARNTASAFEVIHRHGHVLGDVNQGNVLVGADSRVMLIDSDSMQITAGGHMHLCEVGVSHFTPPELQGASNFASVARTPNHDAFGLALLIFHLLFGGRHPFAGRPLLDSVGNSLEDDIRGFRFAYGSDAGKRGFAPPPRSIAMDLVPAPTQAMFQRSFTETGANPNGRPTAGQWIAELDRLRGTLKTCSKSRMHVFPGHLLSCPWCALDQSGVVFFIDLTVYTSNVGSTFVLAQVWAAIEAVKMPSMPSAPKPGDFVSAPAPLPAGMKKKSNRAALWIGTAIVLTGFAVAFPQIWVLFGLLGLGIWLTTKDTENKAYAEEMARRRAVRQAAQSAYDRLLDGWREPSATRRFSSEKQGLSSIRDTYTHLPAAEKRLLDQVNSQARARQLKDHLDRFFIDDASIAGLGPAKKAALRSFGVETAADVDWESVMAVRGFGQKLTATVMAWRAQCESSFRFDGSPKALQVDIARVKSTTAAERAKLEADLRGGPERLGRIKVETEAALTRMRSSLSIAARELSQADADLQV